MISRFPKYGKGFKVFKKTWPEDVYWLITHVDPKNPPTQIKYYGLRYEGGKLQSESIHFIQGTHKRGIWQFDMNNQIHLSKEELAKAEAKQEEGEQAAQ